MKKQCITLVAVLFGLALFFSCNPNEDTGANLTPGDLLTPVDNAHDIYFIDNNTLYGVRDNQDPSVEGVGQMEAFLEIKIPSVTPTLSTPVVISASPDSRMEAGGYGEKKIAVVSGDGILYLYNIPSGELLWQLELRGQVRSTPSIRTFRNQDEVNTHIYIGTALGTFYCVDVLNERLVWSYEHVSQGGFETSTTDNRTGITSVATTDGYVYAFGLAGNLLWSVPNLSMLMQCKPMLVMVPANNGLDSELASVIVGTMDGNLISLDGTTGAQLWSNNLDGSPIISTPYSSSPFGTIPPDTFYANTLRGRVHNVAFQDGRVIGDIQLDASSYSTPARIPGNTLLSANDFLYVNSEKTLFALNLSQGGDEAWSLVLDPPVYATPNVVPSRNNGTGIRCYINTVSGLYGINGETGVVFSEFRIPGFTGAESNNLNYQSSPVVVYVESGVGTADPYHPKNIL